MLASGARALCCALYNACLLFARSLLRQRRLTDLFAMGAATFMVGHAGALVGDYLSAARCRVSIPADGGPVALIFFMSHVRGSTALVV
ncbi:hypothetical protein F4859DRAFT_498562 [Xylaria cf. heliscus]|nr:hypothetical protein F4859DRAFT_498562 [Xylaria cf. heliscus]